jgi:hypothetical protein
MDSGGETITHDGSIDSGEVVPLRPRVAEADGRRVHHWGYGLDMYTLHDNAHSRETEYSRKELSSRVARRMTPATGKGTPLKLNATAKHSVGPKRKT